MLIPNETTAIKVGIQLTARKARSIQGDTARQIDCNLKALGLVQPSFDVDGGRAECSAAPWNAYTAARDSSEVAEIQHLWHGTQSGWLPGIVTSGLGGRNPHDELETKRVLHQMVRALEDHGADLPGPAPGIPSVLRLVAGTVPSVEFAGRPVNFEYGATYASLGEGVATMYANKFCGELFEYAWQAALRLQNLGFLSEVPEWRGWGLIQRTNIPILLRLPRLPLHRFQNENGGNLSNLQRRMLSGTDAGGMFLATDLAFRLRNHVPTDLLVGVTIQHRARFCPRCLVRANPLAFPDLPSDPIGFDADAVPKKGTELQFGAFSDCENVVHNQPGTV